MTYLFSVEDENIHLHVPYCFKTYPHVWSFVAGPKSTYIPIFSPNHIPRSLLPRNGLDASLSSKVITSAPEIMVFIMNN
jgi:hypothetical protein